MVALDNFLQRLLANYGGTQITVVADNASSTSSSASICSCKGSMTVRLQSPSSMPTYEDLPAKKDEIIQFCSIKASTDQEDATLPSPSLPLSIESNESRTIYWTRPSPPTKSHKKNKLKDAPKMES